MSLRIAPHLKGHVFLFDRPAAPTYDPAAGVRLLLIFLLLEVLIGPRLWIVEALDGPTVPGWVRVPVLLAAALLLIRYFARVKFFEIGLKRWRDWSLTERSYFIQVIILINVLFFLLLGPRLRALFLDPDARSGAPVVFLTYLVWGFYQELMYRGILQTELVRRWGVWPGILVSNLLYTFGPLHLYHFSEAPLPRVIAMFTAIFLIGIFFAVLFRRSGNLWLVGTFHGIGDCYFSAPSTLA